eukprot:m.73700 g.73700  ORF g.73700 m.73700 type:complete len:511 (+) comp8038_c0_seq2:133-1665(+)
MPIAIGVHDGKNGERIFPGDAKAKIAQSLEELATVNVAASVLVIHRERALGSSTLLRREGWGRMGLRGMYNRRVACRRMRDGNRSAARRRIVRCIGRSTTAAVVLCRSAAVACRCAVLGRVGGGLAVLRGLRLVGRLAAVLPILLLRWLVGRLAAILATAVLSTAVLATVGRRAAHDSLIAKMSTLLLRSLAPPAPPPAATSAAAVLQRRAVGRMASDESRRVAVQLLAGFSSGFCSVALLHPLDLVKIRAHVHETHTHGAVPRGVLASLRHAWRQGGIRQLYQGVAPNLLGSSTAWGIYWCTYDSVKRAVSRGRDGPLTTPDVFLAATACGAITQLATNPIWVVKTRMCLQANTGPGSTPYFYNSLGSAFQSIWRAEGVRGFYRGFLPGLVGTTHGGFQFVAYENLKHYLNARKGRSSNAKLSVLEYIAVASMSKTFAQVVTYPYQVVRSRLQNSVAGSHEYTATTIMRELWRNNGFAGFYKGLTAAVLRVLPATCVTFVVYENLSRLA